MTETIVLAKELAAGLAAVWHAVGTEDNRPVLQTVCFEAAGDALRLVAADNYRIALYDVRLLDESTAEPFAGRALLPRASVAPLRAALAPLKGPVRLTVADGRLQVAWGDGATEFRLMDGTFPNYAQILPERRVPAVSLNPRYVAEAGRAFRGAKAITLDLESADPLKPFVLRADGCPLVEIIMLVRTMRSGDAAEIAAFLTGPTP